MWVGGGGGNNVNLHFRKLRRKAEFISEKRPFTENRLEIVVKLIKSVNRIETIILILQGVVEKFPVCKMHVEFSGETR